MKTSIGTILLLAGALQFGGCLGFSAESTKSYQVTGPVIELTDKLIVVQKGNERWELARDEKTQVDGDLKVGSKVTVRYRMVAVSVDVSAEKGGAKKKSK